MGSKGWYLPGVPRVPALSTNGVVQVGCSAADQLRGPVALLHSRDGAHSSHVHRRRAVHVLPAHTSPRRNVRFPLDLHQGAIKGGPKEEAFAAALRHESQEEEGLDCRSGRRLHTRRDRRHVDAPFHWSWRYWKLIILGQKFLIILIDAFKTKSGDPIETPIYMLLVHTSMLLLALVARPYTDNRPDLFAIAVSSANVFNFCVLIMFAMRVKAPGYLLYLIVIANFVLPFVAYGIGWKLNLKLLALKKAQAYQERESRKKKYVASDMLVKQRKGIERAMNEFTLRFISKWSWAVLICACISGELIFIGTFSEAALTPVSGHTAGKEVQLPPSLQAASCYQEEYARNREFLGYNNWTDFVDHCCCMSRHNMTAIAPSSATIELWACTSSVDENKVIYKERQRRPMQPDAPLVPYIRGFCETSFRNRDGSFSGAEPVWDDDLQLLGVW